MKETKRKAEKDNAEYSDFFEDDIKFYQEAFLLERLSGIRELSEEKTIMRMRYLHIHMPGPQFVVVIFAPYLMQHEGNRIDQILRILVNSVKTGFYRAGLDSYSITDNYCNIISVISLANEGDYEKVCAISEELTNNLIQKLDTRMFTAIGGVVNSFSDINKSREAAKEGLAYKFTFARNNVINSKDVERIYNNSTVKYGEHVARILGAFYDGNMQLLRSRLNELITIVENTMNEPLDSMKNLAVEMTASVMQRTREIGLSEFCSDLGVYTGILTMTSIDEIEEWFVQFCSQATNAIQRACMDKNSQAVSIAKKFILDNLGNNNLSLQMVSEYVSFSNNYFGDIFFKETGTHLNEYINMMRVEKAKEMLKTTSMKAVDIAEKTGFSSATYFNNVFKKYTGTSPNKYRLS